MKFADTLRASDIVTVQASVPVQAPPQPTKVVSAAGVAVNVTLLSTATSALQAVPQLIAAGEEVMLPTPVPLFATVSAKCVRVKTAPTLRASLIVTAQVPVPLQAPLQPANTVPLAGVAVSVTPVPLFSATLQVAPQLIPAGDDETVPTPVPLLATVSG